MDEAAQGVGIMVEAAAAGKPLDAGKGHGGRALEAGMAGWLMVAA